MMSSPTRWLAARFRHGGPLFQGPPLLQGPLPLGLLLCALVIASAVLGPWLYGGDPYRLNQTLVLAPPGWHAPLGTDDLGRDALARLLTGGIATLEVSIPAALLAFVTGTAYGLLAALGPAWLDRGLMRLLDAVLALPTLVILIFFAALVPLNVGSLILLLGFISWPALARLVRNETQAQAHRDFVQAARQLGAGTVYIARVHLLRVMAPLLVVNATFLIGDSIFALSALSFLGLGVQPPHTSWGGLLQAGLTLAPLGAWWLILPPGLMIFASLLAVSLTGRGLLARWDARR